ncbi:MAG: dihydropteroate synthase [Proteobacteria bacterium]|nr:dihydropteroate synthase [Pseudomonadota bacterium]
MLVVGERINSSRKGIEQAMRDRNAEFITKESRDQVAAGAHVIDVNTATLMNEEVESLKWAVQLIGDSVNIPICIDSPSPVAVAAVLPLCKGKAMVNSITAEAERYAKLIPLIREHKPNVVGLCMDDRGMPNSAEDRIRIASDLVGKLTKDGVPIGDIYIDPVVTPVSTDTRYGMAVLDAIEAIMKAFPGVHTICGLSNVSYGLPNRKQVNQMFLVMAMTRGLDAVILDPCDKRIMANLITTTTLLGKDEFCMNYLAAFREGKFD